MSKQYSILDSAHCDADLDISDAGSILSPSASGTNAHRMCRGTVPLGDTISQFETMAFASPGSSPSLSGAVYVGIVNSSAPTNKYVGEDANGYGFRYDDGKLYNNGSSVATFASCALNDVVNFQIDMDSSPQTITVYKNGTPIGSYDLPSAGTWYPAVTVSGNPALTLNVFFNAGQKTFQFNPSGGEGWWDSVPTPATRYVADFPYLTQSGDSLAVVRFDAVTGAVLGENMSFPRGAVFWLNQSSSRATTSLSTLSMEDPDGSYDFLLDERNANISIATVDQGGAYDGAQIEDNVILDRCETASDEKKTLYLADPIAQILSLPFNTAYFLPNQDVSVVDTPLPVLIGAARNFTPVCEDPTNLIYRISDRRIGAVGVTRVQGVPLAYNGSPGYSFLPDGCRIQLTDAPAGTLTTEASSVYQGLPPGPTDILGGTGDFESHSSSATFLANWQTNALGSDSATTHIPYWDTVTIRGITVNIVRLDIDTNTNSRTRSFRTKSNVIQAGKSYLVEVEFIDTCYFCTQQPLDCPTTQPANFFIDGHVTAAQHAPIDGWSPVFGSVYYESFGYPNGADYSADHFNTSGTNIQATVNFRGTVSIHLTNTGATDLPLALCFVNGNHDNFVGSWDVTKVVGYELPDALDAVPLQGETLEGYMRAVLSRAGVSEGQWDASQAAAIDAATGYQIGAWFTNTPTTVQDALQPALDSFGAGIYRKRDGRMGVVRLIDPDSVADADVAGEITESYMLAEPQVYPDVMREFTASCMGRKNYNPLTESDFANVSTTDVSIQERKALERQYQLTYTSGTQLAEPYRQSQLNKARTTLFDLKADMGAETERTAALAAVPRKFFELLVAIPPGTQYEVGQVYFATYKDSARGVKRYLDHAKVFVCAVDPNPEAQTCTLTVWR